MYGGVELYWSFSQRARSAVGYARSAWWAVYDVKKSGVFSCRDSNSGVNRLADPY